MMHVAVRNGATVGWRSRAGRGVRRLVRGAFGALAMVCAGTLAADDALAADAADAAIEKFDLWDTRDGPHLRGAVAHQMRVYPEYGGDNFMGPGRLGPPFAQHDFDLLARLGANTVVLSHPGLFTERPPYGPERAAVANLDRLLAMIAKADLFAVIAFRTGPGRSEFTFYPGERWFDPSRFNDSVWASQEAHAAWAEMWRYTAERYRDNPIVVGYQLMVEPNSNAVGSHAENDALDLWDPEEFERLYGGTLYDWNRLYPGIVAAIRAVDRRTPILLGGNGYHDIDFLGQLRLTGDPRTVYLVHTYAPRKFTHQSRRGEREYPGMVDADWDGRPEWVDQRFIEGLFDPVRAFQRKNGIDHFAVTEFGTYRWVRGAPVYLDDMMATLEGLGFNHMAYRWAVSYRPYVTANNHQNYRFGPDPDNVYEDLENPLIKVLTKYWQRNRLRPSTVRFATSEAD